MENKPRIKLRWALWGSWAYKPFVLFVSCRQYSSLHARPWLPTGRFKQLLIKGGAAKNPPEARLMGPKKSIRRPPQMRLEEYRPWTHHNDISNLTLELLLWNYSEVLCSPGLGHIVIKGRNLLCPPLLFFSTSVKILSPRFRSAPMQRPSFRHQEAKVTSLKGISPTGQLSEKISVTKLKSLCIE